MTVILNLRSGVMHRFPAFESCNVDAIPLDQRVMASEQAGLTGMTEYKRPCKRCYKEKVQT